MCFRACRSVLGQELLLMYCVQSPNSVLIAIGELNEPDTKVLILQLIDVSMVVKLPLEKKADSCHHHHQQGWYSYNQRSHSAPAVLLNTPLSSCTSVPSLPDEHPPLLYLCFYSLKLILPSVSYLAQLPFALIPILTFTSLHSIMNDFANGL